MNRIIDVMVKYECPLYDPQVPQRYDEKQFVFLRKQKILDTEHGLEIKLVNNKVETVAGIAETN